MPEFVNEQPMYENRPIPTDEQAERFLLGGILRDPDVMGSVVTVIVDDNFFFLTLFSDSREIRVSRRIA